MVGLNDHRGLSCPQWFYDWRLQNDKNIEFPLPLLRNDTFKNKFLLFVFNPEHRQSEPMSGQSLLHGGRTLSPRLCVVQEFSFLPPFSLPPSLELRPLAVSPIPLFLLLAPSLLPLAGAGLFLLIFFPLPVNQFLWHLNVKWHHMAFFACDLIAGAKRWVQSERVLREWIISKFNQLAPARAGMEGSGGAREAGAMHSSPGWLLTSASPNQPMILQCNARVSASRNDPPAAAHQHFFYCNIVPGSGTMWHALAACLGVNENAAKLMFPIVEIPA